MGVKMPVVIPPISRTGVMIGSTAWKLNIRSAVNSAINPAKTVIRGGKPSFVISSHITRGQPTTTTVSAIALITRGHSNLMSAPQPFLWAKYATVSIISMAINKPGKMPARNSAPTLTLAIMP